MQDKELLVSLLECEYEDDVIATLSRLGLFQPKNAKRWVALGNMANNQSVVRAAVYGCGCAGRKVHQWP